MKFESITRDYIIAKRKKQATKLKSQLKRKLISAQVLVVNKITNGESEIILEFTGYGNGVSIKFEGHFDYCKDESTALLNHWDFMNYEYDNSICEFYKEQIEKVDKWIEVLKNN